MTEQEERSSLLESLDAISPMPADDALTEELLARHESIISALRPIANQECIGPLIASFGYGDAFEGYWMVVHLLETLPRKSVHEALLTALETGAEGARMWSAFMLGRHRQEDDVATLVKAIDDPFDCVRMNVVRSLGAIGTSDAINAVREKARDPSKKVREWAIEILKRLDDK